MMSLILNKFSFVFFLLISGSLFSSTFAGRGSKFVSKLDAEEYHVEEGTWQKKEEIAVIHERVLLGDYGRYDPSPNFYRPRHKMIPN
ncbi:hypothetical protein QN277_005034 [Acacia crassicarpa]|uniref:Uncharacterized protein n=2 Tax=Acacia crassicarpa TaxID=499986 RepID=A0AAE1IVT7_9FABA|nr:hypothetical protein QN277_005034 [Acacia crassicarpa]